MKNSFWHEVPLARLLLPFVAGIATSMFISIPIWVAIGVFLLVLLVYFLTKWLITLYSQRWLIGLIGIALFYVLGITIHLVQNQKQYANHFLNQPALTKILVQVTEPPLVKTKSYQLKTKAVLGHNSQGVATKASGKLVLYLAKSNLQPLPIYGDLIWVNTIDIKPIEGPKNPYEFNYKRYLAFNQVFAQAYIQQVHFANANIGNLAFKFIYQCQQYFKQVIQTYIIHPNAIGVAQALLYGNDNDIDKETMYAYANTGTLHVLAVSGMHVGLIYYLLNLFLFFLNKNKKSRLVKQLLVLVCIWIYSALCGLSPSILRATVMISFIIGAEMLNRKTNVYNTLAASCLFILMFDVNVLANVGFQLSYLAVLGIVFIQPMLYKWYLPHNKFTNEVWKICTVSVAAQLTTTPIGLLYFHQFPNCFLFSNLLIIPITTVILYACILLLVVSKLTAVALWLGTIIKYLILFTNQMVQWVEGLPYAYINGIEIGIPQAVLLYVLLFCLIFYAIHKFKLLLYTALLAAWFLSITFALNETVIGYQKKLWVYATGGDFAAGIYEHRSATLLLSASIKNNPDKFRFHLQQHIWHLHLNRVDTMVKQPTDWLFMHENNQTIAIAGNGKPSNVINAAILVMPVMVDVHLLDSIRPKKVVVAGKLSRHHLQMLQNACSQKGIVFFDTQKSGAIELLL